MCSAVPDGREARGDGSTMGAGNSSWGQVLVTTARLWLSRRMPRVSIERPDMAASLAASDRAAADRTAAGPGPKTAGGTAAGGTAAGGTAAGGTAAGGTAAGNPSWGQVLATTVRLWLSRRMPRVSIEWRHHD